MTHFYIAGGVLMGTYILSSVVLLKIPTLLHRKKKQRFTALHISHRGGAAENLENTMEAFRFAERVGTEMLELDCHMTRDQQVVVSHDNSLTRTCGQEVEISLTDYRDLPLMKPELKVDFYASLSGRGSDRRIPLLEEVFRAFPNLPVNVDIKANDDLLMEKVNELITEYKREEITVWGNKSHDICNKLYALNPNIPMLFSLRKVVYVILLFWTGLLPFVPLRESFLEVGVPGLLLDGEIIFGRKMSRKARFVAWIFDVLLMRPALISHLEKRGIQTYLWVLNRESDFERALQLGAAGIMTDRPTLLAEFLRDKKQKSGVSAEQVSESSCRRRLTTELGDGDN